MVVAALLAVPTVAAAESNFVSLGVGATANTGDLGEWEGDGMAGSLAVGHRMGIVGLEVGLMRYGLRNEGIGNWDNTALHAAGSLHIPLGPMLGAYGRLGIEKVWMNAERQGQDFSGTGWLAGLGAELKLDLGFASGAVFLDFTRHGTEFVSDEQARDGHVDIVQLGISVGF